MLNELEAPLVEEFILAETAHEPLCGVAPPFPSGTGPFPKDATCVNEHGHQDTAHVSNPYFNLSALRHESFVWGVDDNGFSFSYAVDLDSLEEQGGRTYTLAEIVAELGDTKQEGGDAWSL